MNRLTSFALALSIGLSMTLDGQSVRAEDTDVIRYGETAVTFASGAIQKTTPRDGFVNLVTGDNQASGNRMLLGRRDVLYLKLDHPTEVAIGDLFTVYKRVRKVVHPMTKEYLGFVMLRLAVVKVIDNGHALTTVQAVTSYGQISPGDPVMRFAAPSTSGAEVSLASNAPDLNGMVVELQVDRPMTMVSQFNVVYLDRGSADGLKPGDFLEVHRQSVGLPVRTVGQLKVLSTEEHTATARIMKATTRVFKGDRVKLVGYGDSITRPAVTAPSSSKDEQPAEVVADKLKAQDASGPAGQSRINLGDVADSLRYESGEAAIKPEGYKILDQLIEQLRANGDARLIRVEGHTDNVEIGPSLKARYSSNAELSKARASGVVRYLIEKGGLDSARLSSMGYGDSRPVATNANEEGRTKNRRVEVVLYEPKADPQASTVDGPIQVQKLEEDPSILSARGTTTQSAPPVDASQGSGAGTLSLGDQRLQMPAGDGATASNPMPTSPASAQDAGKQQDTPPASGSPGL